MNAEVMLREVVESVEVDDDWRIAARVDELLPAGSSDLSRSLSLSRPKRRDVFFTSSLLLKVFSFFSSRLAISTKRGSGFNSFSSGCTSSRYWGSCSTLPLFTVTSSMVQSSSRSVGCLLSLSLPFLKILNFC